MRPSPPCLQTECPCEGTRQHLVNLRPSEILPAGVLGQPSWSPPHPLWPHCLLLPVLCAAPRPACRRCSPACCTSAHLTLMTLGCIPEYTTPRGKCMAGDDYASRHVTQSAGMTYGAGISKEGPQPSVRTQAGISHQLGALIVGGGLLGGAHPLCCGCGRQQLCPDLLQPLVQLPPSTRI